MIKLAQTDYYIRIEPMLRDKEDFDYYNDPEICDQAYRRIIDNYGESTLATQFSEEERVIVLVWWLIGTIENGGFHYLFESKVPGDPEYKLIIESLKIIGCDQAVQAIEDALCLFPNCNPPEDDKMRIAQYEAYSEEIHDAIDNKFYESIDDIRTRLATYVRQRRFSWKTDA